MCETCGCNITPGNKDTESGKAAVEVLHSLLHENDHQASHNRQHFDRHRTQANNLMSSPRAGKNTLHEHPIEKLGDELNIAVIEGDLETENDANRIRKKGAPAIQITTGSACHLDAHMVHDGLHQLELDGVDILFIENVGNLVCPASFDLGHHRNVTLLSSTEGDDKPAKYPVMFRAADLMLITKADLLEFLDDFDTARATANFRQLAKENPVLTVSSKKDSGMDQWIDWLKNSLSEYRATLAAGETQRPAIQPDGADMHAHDHTHGHTHHPHHTHEHGHSHTHES